VAETAGAEAGAVQRPSLDTDALPSIMDLLERFRHHLSTLLSPRAAPWSPCRAGPDSIVLLDLLQRSTDLHRQELVVAHFDHGISPMSGEVAAAFRHLPPRRGFAPGPSPPLPHSNAKPRERQVPERPRPPRRSWD